MPITLYVETYSEDFAFRATGNRKLVKDNLLAMGFGPDNLAPPFFAAGKYICMLENPNNQGDVVMYLYDPPINMSKADELLGSLSLDMHYDLFMDAYNEINSNNYEFKEKYIIEFFKK